VETLLSLGPPEAPLQREYLPLGVNCDNLPLSPIEAFISRSLFFLVLGRTTRPLFLDL